MNPAPRFSPTRAHCMTPPQAGNPPPSPLPPDTLTRLAFAALLVGHRILRGLSPVLRGGLPSSTAAVFSTDTLQVLQALPEGEVVAPLPPLLEVLDSHAGEPLWGNCAELSLLLCYDLMFEMWE